MTRRELRMIVVLLALFALTMTLSACQTSDELTSVRVALVVSPGYYPNTVNEIRSALKKKGANVVLVGAETGSVNYWGGTCQSVTIQQAIRDISIDDFDALYVTDASALARQGTPLKEAYVSDFLRAFVSEGKLVAGVGRGVTLLLEAGALAGKPIAIVAPEQAIKDHGATLAQGNVAEGEMILTATVDGIQELNKTFLERLAKQ